MLLLLILVAILGLATWFLVAGPNLATDQETTERAAQGATADDGGALAEIDIAAPRTASGIEVGPTGEYAHLARTFDGVGTIHGEIRVEGGTFPETWTLHVQPSRHSEGRKSAEGREFVSEPGMTTYEERDLPMGAYRVSATAPGMASREIEVMLFRLRDHPGSPGVDNVNLDLLLRPLAYVEGRVLRFNGNVAEDLPMTLMERRTPGSESDVARYDAVTNEIGQYRFEAVPPGPWLLHVGGPNQGLVAPVPVQVGTSATLVDDIELPALARLELTAFDDYDRPFPDVEITGYLRGNGKGSFRGTTDAVGSLVVDYLTPGPWRLDGKYEPEGQSGRMDISLDVVPGAEPTHLRLR